MSLFGHENSLLCRVGNFGRKPAESFAFRVCRSGKSYAEMPKFSVLSLLNREFEPETGSLETGSSATQSVSAAYVPNRDSNWRRSAVFSKRTGPENNPQLKQFRDKLVAAGKPKLLALVAVARKLITSLTRS